MTPGRVSGRINVLILAGALGAAGLGVGVWASSGAGQAPSAALGATPELGLPATDIHLMGASPDEAPGEVWGYGAPGPAPASVAGHTIPDPSVPTPIVILRRTDAEGWQIVQQPLGGGGASLTDFEPAGHAGGVGAAFALAGQVTSAGGGVLAGSVPAPGGATRVQTLLVRDPGGRFTAVVAPPTTGVLPGPERLFSGGQLAFAPVDEGGHTGVFVAPARPPDTGPVDGVLHYRSGTWTREPIQVPAGWSDLRPLAVAASAPDNAWLLAASTNADHGLALFARDPSASGGPAWTERPLSGLPAPGHADPGPRPGGGQQLTVTSTGVWIDAQLTSGGQAHDLVLYYRPGPGPSTGAVAASWCDLPGACTYPLGSRLSAGEYRSFAWPGGGGARDFGSRVISGAGNGVTLRLSGTEFERVLGVGGDFGTGNGAAFVSPDGGWIAAPLLQGVTRIGAPPAAGAHALQPWPVPFRRPLTAIAPEPGALVGADTSQALAVGDGGTVARFVPGRGWVPEFMYSAGGTRATPRLRGVAWPEEGRAYAVGDLGQMWLWRSDTGLWEPDPARPINFFGNLTGVAFDPGDPSRGYAVGKQGVILSYDKTWTPDPPPAGLEGANFTSISFAGSEALVTYRMPSGTGSAETGGLIVNEGSGWRVDAGVASALAAAGINGPGAQTLTPLEQVAGLPDGGAVAAGPGVVLERDQASAPWHLSTQPLAEATDIAAVAAVRDGPSVHAVVSIDAHDNGRNLGLVDNPAPAPPGHPPPRIDPDPFPVSGYLVRESAGGWQDEEHAAFPLIAGQPGFDTDQPVRTDEILALLVDPSGARGWAVGGETGAVISAPSTIGAQEAIQTAGIARYPAAGSPPPTASAPIPATAGQATFAVGGNAQCALPCADLARDDIGRDVWLPHALNTAARVGGGQGAPRAFLYTGAAVAPVSASGATLGTPDFAREENRYADLLSQGTLPVFAAPSPSDLDAAGSLSEFATAFGGFGAPFGHGAPSPPIRPVSRSSMADAGQAGGYYYAFDSSGSTGTVRVIVLDYSQGTLGGQQECWLAQRLSDARGASLPALVVGNSDVNAASPSGSAARDAPDVTQILVSGRPPAGVAGSCPIGHPGSASAYLFDAPGETHSYQLTYGSDAIPEFGTGTLGYTAPPAANQTDYFGAAGFLLVDVDVAHIDPGTGRAPVSARLVPDIAQLALEATDGVLLRRSHVALFQGLARRPQAGIKLDGENSTGQPDPYVPVPERCQGGDCGSFVAPEYSFSSSRPDIGDFVRQDPTSINPRAIFVGPDGLPVADSHSGLFCAFNAGTTTVSITAGGLSYSQDVTVQPGTAARPCGTVPLRQEVAASQDIRAPVVPPIRPPAAAAPPSSLPPPVPVPPHPPAAAIPPPPAAARPAPAPPPTPVFQSPQPASSPAVLALPPVPPGAQPAPPTGSSSVPVSEPVAQPEEKKEEELAEEGAYNQMSAYSPHDQTPLTPYLIGLVVLAAAAGAGFRRRGSPRSERVRAAPAQSAHVHVDHTVPSARRPPGRL